MRRPNPIVPLLLAATLAAGPAAAQSPLLDHGTKTSAWFQLQRPSIPGGASVWLVNAGAVATAAPGIQLLLEVPFVYVAESGLDKNTLIGNPYFAVRATNATTYFELGARAPAVGSNSAWIPAEIGAAADFDNWEAYLANIFTVSGALGYDSRTGKDGLVTHLRGGVATWVPTRGGGNVQLMGSYMGLLGYRSGGLELTGGITGRYIINNAEGANFGERTVHQGVVGFTWRQGGARPTVFLRLPLDQDAKDMYKTVIGLGVSLDLR